MTDGTRYTDHLIAALAVEWHLLTPEQSQSLLDETVRHDVASGEDSDGGSAQTSDLLQRLAEMAELSAQDIVALQWMVEQTLRRRSADSHGDAVETTAIHVRENVSLRSSGQGHEDATLNPEEDAPRYHRKEFHARGGSGQIWLARDNRFGRDVALKELQPDRSHKQSLRRFVTEARVTGQLEHPGIVPVYELHESDDAAPFYTMRFIQGQTLAEAIADFHQMPSGSERSLKFVELLNAITAVCNTVHYAHSHGVIHRDLKGRNVVLGEFGEVMVLDWGVARIVGDEEESLVEAEPGFGGRIETTQDGSIVGTPSYMSPEQAKGDNEAVGPASDVYSMGVILYELLAGKLPFEADYVSQLLEKVIALNPARPSHIKEQVPRALEAICLKSLKKDPADRYVSARELGNEIRRYLADEPVDSFPDSLPTRLSRWARRHRLIVTTAASIALVLLVGLSAGSFLLADANRRINQEKNKAERLAKEANQNFEDALASVNEFYNVVSENRLLHVPRLSQLRDELLTNAMGYYERFANKDAKDPHVRALLAEARYRMARIHLAMGEDDRATKQLLRCIEIFEDLRTNDNPDLGSVTYSKVLSAMGEIKSRKGHPSQSSQYRRNGLRMLRQHLEQFPHDIDAQVKLSQLLSDEAHFRYTTQHINEAVEPITESVAISRKLLKEHNQERFQMQLAESLSFSAIVARDLGDIQRAENRFQECLDIYEAIQRASGLIPREQAGVSQCYHSLGMLLRRTGRSEQALPLLTASASLRQALIEEFPSQPSHRSAMALTKSSIGVLHWANGDYEKAEAHYAESNGLLAALTEDFPDNLTFRNDLAGGYNNVAMVYRAQDKRDKAIETYTKCIEIRRALLSEMPESLDVSVQLGNCYSNLGQLYFKDGKPATALQWKNEAVALLERVRKRVGDDPRLRSRLSQAHRGRAQSLVALSRFEEGIQEWQIAADLESGQEQQFLLMRKARAMAVSGHPEQAAEEAKSLLETGTLDSETLFDSARVFSICHSKTLESPNADRQSDEAKQYLTSALDALQQAAASGYFEDAGWEELEREADLAAIRDAALFRDFMRRHRPATVTDASDQ